MRDNMYTVFMPRKELVFAYKIKSMWSYVASYSKYLINSKDVYKRNEFMAEEKSMEEIYRMIAEGFVFFPINKGTKAIDIKNYIEMGFKVAFLRAGEFRKFQKDYKNFI